MDSVPAYLKPMAQSESITGHEHTQASYTAIQAMGMMLVGLVLFVGILYLFI